jgi:hypothetical protein
MSQPALAMVAAAAAWVATVSDSDGGVPFVLPTTAAHPHAPWMVPADGGSQLTFALAPGWKQSYFSRQI